MSHSTGESTRFILNDAQAAESKGDWQGATAKRAQAISDLLNRAEPKPYPRSNYPVDELEQLGEVHKPTKRNHDYLQHYWTHFRDVRLSAKKVVEIGVQTPRSVNMWEEFFPNATIFGLDIDPACAAYAGGRKEIHIGDQMDEAFLMKFIRDAGGDFDIVIDDGLHTSYSMMKTFSYFYPALKDHGLYVIEDIQQKPDILRFLHTLMEGINFIPPNYDLRDWLGLSEFGADVPWLVRNTVGVSFYRYIAFISRGFNPRDNHFLRDAEEFKAGVAKQLQVVHEAALQLQQQGIAVTRDSLLAKLDTRLPHYVDRYLSARR